MRIITLASVIISGFFLFSSFSMESGKTKERSENYIVPETGDTIFIKGEVSMGAQFMDYKDMKGKSHSMAQSKVDYMVVAGRHFKNLPIYSLGMKRLHEIIATNRDNILTLYFSNGYYLYIWDRKFEPVEKKVDVVVTKKWQTKLMEKHVKPYFGTCTEMIAFMEKNIAKDVLFSTGVEDFECTNTGSKESD